MNIGDAVSAMQDGARVTRQSWSGKTLELLHGRFFGGPVIVVQTVGGFEPYACTQSDLLADDWMFVCEPQAQQSMPRYYDALPPMETQPNWRC
jgi:hypothetical protein